MVSYIVSFLAVIFVVSTVSAIIESKSSNLVRESIKMFIVTSVGMGVIAFIIFILSR